MSAPVLRISKLKATGRSTPQSVQGHLARTSPTRNADAKRTVQNEWLVGSADQDLAASIRSVMQKAGIDPTKLRKDATIANDIVLTASPEWFRPGDPTALGTWEKDRLDLFRQEAQQFLARFGVRLVSAVLHLDESTPHIQAVVVPLMRGKNGSNAARLCGKDLFNPDGLRALQQGWEDRMAQHGVGPRIKGSTARHNPLKRFYSALEGFEHLDPLPALSLTDPPLKKVLEPSQRHSERVSGWKAEEVKRIRRKLGPLSVEAAKGRLYEAERREADQLRGHVREQRHEIAQAHEDVAAARTAVTLSKDEVSALRQVPLNQVVAMLGYTGPVAQRENAIDLVKRVGEFSFNDAVTWLAQRFDPQTAATAVREVAEREATVAAAAGKEVFSKAEMTKRQIIGRQLDALAAPAYRITTMMVTDDGKKIGKNLGKSKVENEPEKTYTKKEVLDLIPQLTVENHAGRNVFVTPLDDHAWHVLVDDVKSEGLRSLETRGFSPCLSQETSPANFQVVLKIPKNVTTPFEAVNEVFKDLNRDVGDTRITALTHGFRLAGFENRKEKHKNSEGLFPWVKLAVAVNRMCRKTLNLALLYAKPTAELPHL